MEDIIFMVIGFAMMYTWVHSMVIISQKLKGTTAYESVVLIVAAMGVALFLIGSMV